MTKVKTQIIFPEDTLKKLDRVVKKRERSNFVVEAVEERLKGIKLQNALKVASGLWKDREDMKTDKDIKKYLKSLRGSDAAREKRLRRAWQDG